MTVEAQESPEFQVNPDFQDVTLFTGTFYGDDPSSKVRQELALELLDRTEAAGVRIVVVDGGSSQDFLDQAGAHPNVTLLKEPEGSTMGGARRFGLDKAMDDASEDPDHIFVWLEPEKVNLVDPEVITKLVQPIRDSEADVVVPHRTDMSTLPKQQAWLEQRANHRATKLLRGQDPASPDSDGESDLDLWFGPKVFNRSGAKYFSEYDGKLDKWDSIIAPVLDAAEAGLAVADVPVDFVYPESQSAHETANAEFERKRLVQYGTILVELGDTFWQDHELRGGAIRTSSPKE